MSGSDANQQPTRSGTSLNRGSTPYLTATFTTSAAHGLVLGQVLAVAGAKIGGNPAPADTYNGVFVVASVPNPTQFTYQMKSAPSDNADASPAPKFGALWQVGRLVIENNIIELVLTITTLIDLPTAVRLERIPSTPAAPVSPYALGQVVVRGNCIRHVDNTTDASALPLGIQLFSCEAAVIEDNVIRLDGTNPIQFSGCGTVKFFNNQAPSGLLIQGFDVDNAHSVNELATDADLSLLLAT